MQCRRGRHIRQDRSTQCAEHGTSSTSNPTLKLTLKWEGASVASTTLTENDATATFGGKVPDSGGLEAEATATFNFSTDVLSYSVVVETPGVPHVSKGTKKTYSGSTTIKVPA